MARTQVALHGLAALLAGMVVSARAHAARRLMWSLTVLKVGELVRTRHFVIAR